jgi:uncharacterized protein (TIGR02466 family)
MVNTLQGVHMELNFEYLFSTYLTTLKNLNIDNDSLEEYAYLQREKDNGVEKSNWKGWQSDTLEEQNSEVEKLCSIIEDACNELKNNLGFKKHLIPKINNIWLNINSNGSFNRPHLHPGSIFSGTYYIKKSAEDGNIVFTTPCVQQQYHIEKELIDQFNPTTSSVYSIPTEPGTMILFPSWAEHFVEPNNTDVDRISIAFNVALLEDNT